jgi:hypothetical protein
MIYTSLDQIKSNRVFSALTGLKRDEFEKLLVIFSEHLKSYKLSEYETGKRKRKDGGGSKGVLDTDDKKLFFILHYMKNYPTFDTLGFYFDMDGGNAHEHVNTLLPLVEAALEKMNAMPLRTLENPSVLEKLVKNERIIADATERRCVRPSNGALQKDRYSGKRRCCTLKNTTISKINRQIVYLGKTHSGSIHDYKLLKKELDPSLSWFKNCICYVDLGYQGIQKDYAFPENILIPHKKPRKSKNNPNPTLTDKQKAENKALSKVRIFVEHAIGGMKNFHCLSERCRNHNDIFTDKIIGVAAGLWNMKLLLKSEA